MSRFPPGTYYAGGARDPLPWDDTDPSFYNFDPTERDEYDDFADERSRPHPNLPRPNVQITPAGSIRTSYRDPRYRPSPNSSQYSSQESRGGQITPPRQTYAPLYGQNEHAYGNTSPERSYQDYQREGSPMRSDSPTRVPLTGGAAGAYAGYEMGEVKLGQSLNRAPTSKWLREEKKSRAKRLWIIAGLVLFVLAAAAAGVTVWLVKFHNTGSSSGSSGSSGSANGRNGFGATASDLKKDSSLKKIFPGMDYTPINAQYPACGSIQANVTADVAILSQLTSKVRLYGTDCDQATQVLDAIQDLKVDMTVFLTVWVDGNTTTLNRQLGAMYDILKTYPVDLIDGVAVGNEVLFREDMTEAALISLIKEVRTNVTAMNLGKTIPIGTSDLGSNWTPELSAAVDTVMANIHPFFSGIDVNGAANWTLQFLTNNVVSTTTNLSPKPNIIISEVGWPTGSGSLNSSIAGTDELQYFINTFPAAATAAGVDYYWFEGYDEPWKIVYDTPTEQYEDHWGLLDVNGYLKDGITLPSSV